MLNSGYLRIYDSTGGTGQPTTADTAIGSQVLLAELTINATAFGNAVDGVATANAVTKDSSANNTGTATWFRAVASNGTSVICDGTVGTSGADCNINSTAIQAGTEVSVTAWTWTANKG
jgi:hypothetical protein